MQEIRGYLLDEIHPSDKKQAKRLVLERERFTILDDVLYYVDPSPQHRLRVAVQESLQTLVDILLLEDSSKLTPSDGGGMEWPETYIDFAEVV